MTEDINIHLLQDIIIQNLLSRGQKTVQTRTEL